jgi:hypothetical protein
MNRETEEYLAKIRKTIAESKQMVESAKLRFAETDRMLEESGTTREEVMKMRFSPEQKEAVNAELERRGFPPLEADELQDSAIAAASSPVVGAADVQEDMENRRRKFGAMMKPFRM